MPKTSEKETCQVSLDPFAIPEYIGTKSLDSLEKKKEKKPKKKAEKKPKKK